MTVQLQPGLTQTVQIGQEGTAGTAASCGTRLLAAKIDQTNEHDTRTFRPQGRRFDSQVEAEKDWLSFAVSGDVLYTEVLYMLEAALGTVAPTTVGSSTKKRVYTPALADVIVPKSFTQQWGDSNNVNQATYGVVSDIGFKFDRDTGVQYDGTKGFAQAKSIGATFTASPTPQVDVPVLGNHLNLYLDTTGAGIGVTQVTKEFLDGALSLGGIHMPFWAADRSQASYATVTNGDAPKHTFKFSLAESDLARTLYAAMSTGTTYFMRIDCQGPLTEAGQHYLLRFDMALQLQKTGAYAVKKTVYARDWEFTLVEDVTWASALQITSQTLITSL